MINRIKNFIWFCRNWHRLEELYKMEHKINESLYKEIESLYKENDKLLVKNNELFNAKLDLECEFEQYRSIVSCSSDYKEIIDTLKKYHMD